MNKKNFLKYASKLKTKVKLNEEVIEKDYQLSKFLSIMQELIEQGRISHLTKLIFKGGTLLTKAYLDYHRISEDLDFTHEQSNDLRDLSRSQREREIKKLIIPVIKEIKLICDKAGFKFKTDRTNSKYIRLINRRSVYILRAYYESMITGQESFVKLEINFVEEINNKPINKIIKNFHQVLKIDSAFLKSINFDLKEVELKSYPLKEIILEKFRAIMTRNQLKERDLIDLYLINKKKDVFSTKDELIKQKIKSGERTLPRTTENLKDNYQKIIKGEFDNSTDEVKKLLIKEIDMSNYSKFKTRLFKKIKKICESILK